MDCDIPDASKKPNGESSIPDIFDTDPESFETHCPKYRAISPNFSGVIAQNALLSNCCFMKPF